MTTPTAPTPASLPPLEPGDVLTRDEFERRYEAMPDLKRAELIEGVVHMPAAVRWRHHGSPHIILTTWLGNYCTATPGTDVGDNSSIRLDLENEPQPDATMIIEPACGGHATISEDDYVESAPELVAEVSASSVSIDLHAKRRVYLRNGVREYLVWRIRDRAIDWFILKQGQYQPLQPDAGGILKSEVFPGLWLDAAALVARDRKKVNDVLQLGLATPEHADFVAQLQQRKASQP